MQNRYQLKLPVVSAGEYAEVLSIYIDDCGKKAVVSPGWTDLEYQAKI